MLKRRGDSLPLDVADNLNGRLLDVSHILAVRVLSQVLRSADDDINTCKWSELDDEERHWSKLPSTPVSTATLASSICIRVNSGSSCPTST
jgi:hypothetical protein